MAICEHFDAADCCAVCLKKRRRHYANGRMCSGPPKVNPNLPQRILNFAKALAEHQANGLPQCTPGEIASREAICGQCPLLVGGVCIHHECGCPMARAEKWRDKLTWADAKCPLDRWEKTAWQQSQQPS